MSDCAAYETFPWSSRTRCESEMIVVVLEEPATTVAVALAPALDVLGRLGGVAWMVGGVGDDDGWVGTAVGADGMSAPTAVAPVPISSPPPPLPPPLPSTLLPAIPNFAFSASAKPWSWLLLVAVLLVAILLVAVLLVVILLVVVAATGCRAKVIAEDDGARGARAGCTTTHRSKSLVGDPENRHVTRGYVTRGYVRNRHL